MTGMASSAAIDPPIGTPDIIIVATGPRHFGRISSAASALAVGTRPPRPMPAISRSTPKTTGPVANAHSAVNTDSTTAQPITARLRPIASESRPASTAPIIIPTNARLPRVPAVGGADAPLPLQAGDHVAVDDQVVAVEDDEQPADEDGDQRRAVAVRLGGRRGCGGVREHGIKGDGGHIAAAI